MLGKWEVGDLSLAVNGYYPGIFENRQPFPVTNVSTCFVQIVRWLLR